MSAKRSRYGVRRAFRSVWPAERDIVLVPCNRCGAHVLRDETAIHDRHHALIDELSQRVLKREESRRAV